MFKVLGGVLVGIFIGSVVIDLIRRIRPDLVDGIVSEVKAVSERLIDGVREAYDFRTDTSSTVPDGKEQGPGRKDRP